MKVLMSPLAYIAVALAGTQGCDSKSSGSLEAGCAPCVDATRDSAVADRTTTAGDGPSDASLHDMHVDILESRDNGVPGDIIEPGDGRAEAEDGFNPDGGGGSTDGQATDGPVTVDTLPRTEDGTPSPCAGLLATACQEQFYACCPSGEGEVVCLPDGNGALAWQPVPAGIICTCAEPSTLAPATCEGA